MANEIRDMNLALYNASMHLLEAGKYLSNIQKFREESILLLDMAKDMTDIIQPEIPKIDDERMDSILDEIINFTEK